MLNIKPNEKSLVNFSHIESSAFLTTYLELITHWKAISWPYCFNTELLWPCGGREQKSSCLNLCSVMTDKRPQKKHKLKNRKISSEALYKQSQIFTVDLTVNCLALLLWLSHVYLLCKHRWLSNTDCQDHWCFKRRVHPKINMLSLFTHVVLNLCAVLIYYNYLYLLF